MVPAVGQQLDVHDIDRDRMLDAIEYVSTYARRTAATAPASDVRVL
jgi:hypothetical protein